MTQPGYDRTRLRPRLAHIGFGAFARAHILMHLHEALNKAGGDWGAVAIRLRSGADDLIALDATNGLYTVAELDGDTATGHQIGAVIATAHPARDGPQTVIDHLSLADIVTLTITEKGYGLRGGRLHLNDPAVQHDLTHPQAPRTAMGYLVAGLAQRRAAGLGGQTILSCDNLPMNGRLCECAVLDLAAARDADLASWIRETCRFPSSMVDRIVPALDDAGRAALQDLTGQDSPTGIVTEPFRQWVIEDRFAGPRPLLETGGALIVPDVAPFEDMKLRMLNGAHSFLAYAGSLHGYRTVSECMDDPVLANATRHLMLNDQAPTLDGFLQEDLARYATALLDRFANPALNHRLLQIAMDGSQKLPQRLLRPIANRLGQGHVPQVAIMAVAAWMIFCKGQSETGAALPLSDPLAGDIIAVVDRHQDTDLVHALLRMDAIFPRDLARDDRFVAALVDACTRIATNGIHPTLADAISRETTS